jgi:Ca2+-binding RTX toxin-like protein
MSFDGSRETDGAFSFSAGAGRDTLIGGAGNDDFFFASGEMLTAADHVSGGGGNNNRLFLAGDYSAGLKFGVSTVENIQSINLGTGYSYRLTTNDATVAAGQSLYVNGLNIDASHSLYFNGSAESSGAFNILAGAGNDTLIGGRGNDVFNGGGGADVMTSGGGADQFYYTYVSDSTSTNHDTIHGFNAVGDSFVMVGSMALPNAIDAAVTTGKLTSAAFDTNLSQAVGASQLHPHDAVLFTPTLGNLAGHTFLVIDENGVAGYQAGQDLVVDITGATNLLHLGVGNFI